MKQVICGDLIRNVLVMELTNTFVVNKLNQEINVREKR
jgi:hypothetical protein